MRRVTSERFLALAEAAEAQADDIVASSFENWPAAAVDRAFARPARSIVCGPAALHSLLSHNASYAAQHGSTPSGSWPDVADPAWPGNGAYFPKLGPLSWKERPELARIDLDRDTPEAWCALLPWGVSDRLAAVLRVFVLQDMPTYLHFFPYHDMATIAEARFMTRAGHLYDARWHRPPPRGRLATLQGRMHDLAEELAPALPFGDAFIDLCANWTDDGDVAVLEINPKPRSPMPETD